MNVKAVFTNTVPVDAYRGAGRPEATFQIERVVDKAARELGIDPVEIRRKNFVKPDQFPYQTPVAVNYDIGDYDATMDVLERIADRAGFARRKAESAATRQAARLRRRLLHRGLRHRAVEPRRGARGAGRASTRARRSG